MSLLTELEMADFWVDRHGLVYSLTEGQLLEVAKDPAISSALLQMQNAERAIRARIKELQVTAGVDPL